MNNQPIHHDTAYKSSFTPRQEEVLRLLEKGRSNAEIAEALGVSLDGAKYHVREIIARLGVDSREEAVAAWKQDRTGPRTGFRWSRGLSPLALGLGGAAGVSAVAALVVLASGWTVQDKPGLTGGSPGIRLLASAEEASSAPTGGAARSTCVPPQLSAGLSVDGPGLNGSARIEVTLSSTTPCLPTDVFVSIAPVGKPAVGIPVNIDVAIGSEPVRLRFTWSNWCDDAPVVVSVTGVPALGLAYLGADAAVTCVDGNQPSSLALIR